MDGHRLLRSALIGNALFSAVSGTTALAGAAALDDRLGVPAWFLAALGLGLIGYGGLLAMWARDGRNLRSGGITATLADVGWVGGATVILLAWPDAMTAAGRLTLLVVSLAVADFAIAQALGVRKMTAKATG